MPSYEQVVKFENEKPQGVLRLVEANGFYRAYNHSAFLFHQAIANSLLGVLSHYDSYRMRKALVAKSRLPDFGRISDDVLRFYPDALDWLLYRSHSK